MNFDQQPDHSYIEQQIKSNADELNTRWLQAISEKEQIIKEIEESQTPSPFEDIFEKVGFQPNYKEFARTGIIDIIPETISWHMRDSLVKKYSWAIPNEAALKAIAKHSPIIEIGAGSGYWAKRLTHFGAKVVCYDSFAGNMEHHFHFPVEQGSFEKIKAHPNHTLFLCWPPYEEDLAFNCLSSYRGQYFLYVGELDGCTGDDKFHKLIDERFCLNETIRIPQWYGIRDHLFIYEAF